MAADSSAVWKERVARLKLDPSTQPAAGQEWRLIRIENMEGLAELCDAPRLAFEHPALQPDANLDDADVIRPANLKNAVAAHAFRLATVSKRTQAAVRKSFAYFQGAVYTGNEAGDRDVTKHDPLIIDKASSVTIFNRVRIFPGGYIDITVPCFFEAVVLEKVAGDAGGLSAPTHDFTVRGVDGKDGINRNPADKGDDGKPGTDATCDHAGGCVKDEGGKGHPGKEGHDGDNGGNGYNGDNAPNAVIKVHDLKSSVTLLDVGGRGGHGGHAGRGGMGGTGGRGGNETQCVGCHGYAGAGGTGGDGGTGGTGGTGGNGGDGGVVTIYFKSTNGSQFIPERKRASGGSKGNAGAKGDAGDGGPPGSGGKEHGDHGHEGHIGKDGFPGSQGQLGSILINPPTV